MYTHRLSGAGQNHHWQVLCNVIGLFERRNQEKEKKIIWRRKWCPIPDLAPSDYYLFPNLKSWLAAKRFYSNSSFLSVEWETDAYFRQLQSSYYLEGVKKLEGH